MAQPPHPLPRRRVVLAGAGAAAALLGPVDELFTASDLALTQHHW